MPLLSLLVLSDHHIDWEVRYVKVVGCGPGLTIVFRAGWALFAQSGC